MVDRDIFINVRGKRTQRQTQMTADVIFKLTPEFKSRVRRLVEKAYGVRYASNQAIKKLFPKANLSMSLHWWRIVELAEEHLQASEEPSKIDQLRDAIKLNNCYAAGTPDTFLGVSLRVHQAGSFIGTAGWSHSKNSWVASRGNHGRSQTFQSADHAVNSLVRSTILI